jgi:competence protein ComGF
MRKKIKAFTIVETLVSLTLISISIALGFLLFNYVAVDQQQHRQVPFLVANILEEFRSGERVLEDQSFLQGEYEVEVQVDIYEEREQLRELWLRVFKEEKMVYQRKSLLIEKENED